MSTTIGSGNTIGLYGISATVVDTGYGNANVSQFLAAGTDGSNTIANISATGNVAGNYFIGNGSQLTGIASSYGNANVAAFLPTYTGNLSAGNVIVTSAVTATGNITGGNIVTAGNVSATGNVEANYFIGTFQGNISGNLVVPGANTEVLYNNSGNAGASSGMTFDSAANVFTVSGNITSAANISAGNISTGGIVSATANITGGNIVTAGQVTAGANITGANIITAGLISAIGNIDGGNVNTGTVSATGAVLATGNVTGGNIIASGIVSASGNITTTGNIDAGYISAAGNISAVGDLSVSQITAIGNVTTTGNIQGTTVSALGNVIAGGLQAGNVSVTGNVIGGNVEAGFVSATGNIQGLYFLGNGSQLTGISAGTPGGSNTQIQFNDSGAFAGNAALTFDVGSGNIGIGNLIVNQGQVNTVAAYSITSTGANARIVIGSGYNGDTSSAYDPYNRLRNTRLAVWDRVDQGNTGQTTTAATFVQQTELTANVPSNSNSRWTATQSIFHIGGGASAYQWQRTGPFGLTGFQGGVWLGNQGNVTVGNVTVGGAAAVQGVLNTPAGSTLTNSVNFLGQHTAAGNVTNVITVSPFTQGTPATTPTNYLVYYNPGTGSTYGISNGGGYRAATNYYAFYNEDDVAQVRLGSLRRYHEFSYELANTGNITIDKNNSQVQQIQVAGNINITGFSNFVSEASDGVDTDFQSDTVTIIVCQNSTGYNITMPTGNADIKYAGNITTVGSTANSTSIISVSTARVFGTTQYLVTISPEFV